MGDLFDILEYTEENHHSNISGAGGLHSVQAEFELYLDNKEICDDPLLFWKKHSTHFPRLSILAKQIFCAPASTAGVERLFSVAGHILSPRKMRLTDANFEHQLFANVNFEMYDQSGRKRLRLQ